MTPKVQSTLERVVRVVISIGLVLSVLGTPAFVPLAQAKTSVPEAVEPKQEGTPVMMETPTPEPTSVGESVTSQPVTGKEQSISTEPVRVESAKLPAYTPPLTVTSQLIERAGGQLASADQRIQLEIPAGLFKEATRISISPQAAERDKAPSGLLFQFDLQAQDQASDKALTVFEKPVILTVDLNGLIDRDKLQPFEHLAIFYRTDNPDAPWSELVDAREVRPGIVQVPLTHFSVYAAGSSDNAPAGWHLKYNPPVISTFSGAATFNYPIEVPAGRHGLQPNITLSYNSHSADGVVNVDSEDIDGVPFAWAMDMASINRDGTELDFCGDCTNDPTFLLLHPRFSLAINGSNHDLIPATPGAYSGRYYAKDAPSLYVERHNKYSDPSTYGSIPNVSKEFWIVKTGDGTTYRFGYNSDSEQTQSMGPAHYLHCEDNGYCGEVGGGVTNPPGQGTAAVRWRVDLVTDTVGSQMTFTYHTNVTDKTFAGSGTLTAEHTRPNEIKYNYTNGVAASRVQFYNSQKTPDQQSTVNWFDRIYVYHAGETNRIREYQLGWDGELKRLLSIVPVNGAGTQSLPATTFTYTDLRKDWWDINHTPYLTRIDNGYGGATEFSYLDDGRYHYTTGKTVLFGYSYRVIESRTYDGLNSEPAKVQYAYGTACYDQYGGGVPAYCRGEDPKEFGPLVGHQIVTQTVLAYGGAPLSQQVFTYNVADYNSPLRGRELSSKTSDGSANLLTQADTTYSTMNVGPTTFTYLSEQMNTAWHSGIPQTKRTSSAYDSYGNLTAQYDYGAEEKISNAGFENGLNSWAGFWDPNYPGSLNVSERLAGQNSLQLQHATANGGVFQDITGLVPGVSYTVRAWVKATSGATARFQLWTHDTTGANSTSSPATTPGTSWSQVTWYYTANATGKVRLHLYFLAGTGTLYVDEVALAQTLDVGDERSLYQDYNLNPDANVWIVTKPKRESTYTGIWLNDHNLSYLLSRTRYRYDGRCLNDLPTRGALTAVDRWNGLAGTSSCDDPVAYLTTKTGYDQWGNPTVVTDTRGFTTTTVYDSQYHLYPVQVSNALGQSAWTTYDYARGLPVTVTDPNSAVTHYEYDTFGRLYEVYRPGDSFYGSGNSQNDPSTRYVYRDYGSPLWLSPLAIVEWHKPNSLKQVSRHFYDGLGREIQTHTTLNVTPTGYATMQDLMVSRAYDARGLVISETVPYAAPAYSSWPADPYTTVNQATAPKTLTSYDALGRAVRVTNPDGTVQSTGFSGRAVTSADANEHYRLSEMDARGQLVRVDEMLGNVASQATATASSQYNASYAPSKAVDGNPGSEWATAGQTSNAWIKLTWATAQTVRAVVLRDRSNLTDKVLTGRLQFSDGSDIVMNGGQLLPNEGGPIAITFPAKTITWAQFTIDTGAGANVGLAEFAVLSERNTTRYAYDTVGNLKVVTDAQNNITTINYDALGRKTEMVDPDMGHWTYQYDPAGNLITQTDALNQALWFKYDPLNRLIEKRQTNSTGPLLAKYTFGATAPNIGYRLRLDDPSGHTAWTYDPRGRVTQETKAITVNNVSNVFTTGFGYDALDRVITTTYPATGEVVTQTYNSMGTLETVRSASSAAPYLNQWYVKNLDYNAQGALTLAQLGNNVNTTYTYHPLNFRLQTLNATGLYQLQYGYDNVGNILSWTSLYTAPLALAESMQFQYDALDRLTRAIAVTNGYTGTYAYDKIGNLITKTESTSPIIYTYGVTQPHAVRNLTNGWLYSYDLNGNMTTRVENGVTYTQQWDVENRLKVVTATQGSVISVTHFIYDGDGNRVLQIRPEGGKTVYVGNLLEVEFIPPLAASNLTATAVSPTQINLAWTDNSTNEDSFEIQRRVGVNWEVLNTVGANVTVYSDTNLTCNTTYAYRVRAHNSEGYSAFTNIADALTYLCGPSNLSATMVSPIQINLTWTDNSPNETGFKIERSSNGGSTWAEVATVGVNVTTFSDNNLPCETTYAYRVRAYNAAGQSGYSNTSNATTGLCAPADLLAQAGGSTTIALSWSDTSRQPGLKLGFKIERSTVRTGWLEIATVGANQNTYNDTNLACDGPVNYSYRVRAYNAAGYSEYSNISGARTAPCAPYDLYATLGGTLNAPSADLEWRDGSNVESGFMIQRRIVQGGEVKWVTIGTTGVDGTTYRDDTLACDTTYEYQVRAYNPDGSSDPTNTQSVTTEPCGAPSAPVELSATTTPPSQVNLAWVDTSSDESGFKIERRDPGGASSWVEIAQVGADVTTYTDPKVECGITFSYQVRAFNAYGDSDYTNIASALIPCHKSTEAMLRRAAPRTEAAAAVFKAPASLLGKHGLAAPALSTTSTESVWAQLKDLLTRVWRDIAAYAPPARELATTTLSAPPTGRIWKTYYFAGSQAIAMRVQGDPVEVNNGVFFLHSDHLGSASLTTDVNGAATARQLYDAWGNIRASASSGTMPTDIGYTGQRLDSYINLYEMGARWYSPVLGRWLSPDTIVPEPTNPQAWDRYSYALNNPLKYVDPTGHYTCVLVSTSGDPAACQTWVDSALAALAQAGQSGIDLVDFFRSLDKSKGLFVNFTFLGRENGGPWMAAPPGFGSNTILIDMSLLNTLPQNNLELAALFGHEVFHLGQSDFEKLSMQGEAAAYQKEYDLRANLGIGQSGYSQAAWGPDPANSYDLSTSAGLNSAANALRNVPGSIYTWQSTRPDDKQVETTLFQAGAVTVYGLNRASQGAQAIMGLAGYAINETRRGIEYIFSFQWLFSGIPGASVKH